MERLRPRWGNVSLSANQRYPPSRVSANLRVYCRSKLKKPLLKFQFSKHLSCLQECVVDPNEKPVEEGCEQQKEEPLAAEQPPVEQPAPAEPAPAPADAPAPTPETAPEAAPPPLPKQLKCPECEKTVEVIKRIVFFKNNIISYITACYLFSNYFLRKNITYII